MHNLTALNVAKFASKLVTLEYNHNDLTWKKQSVQNTNNSVILTLEQHDERDHICGP